MKKSKAILVTTAMTLMLVVILAFLFMTGIKVLFYIFCSIFAILGMICADCWLLDWLTDEEEAEELEPVEVCKDEDLIQEAIRDGFVEVTNEPG